MSSFRSANASSGSIILNGQTEKASEILQLHMRYKQKKLMTLATKNFEDKNRKTLK